jgi:hypothetical protein
LFEIWFEQLNLHYSISNDSETKTVFKKCNTHLESISVDEFIQFSEKIHEKFPEITTGDLYDIWCEFYEDVAGPNGTDEGTFCYIVLVSKCMFRYVPS